MFYDWNAACEIITFHKIIDPLIFVYVAVKVRWFHNPGNLPLQNILRTFLLLKGMTEFPIKSQHINFNLD